MLPDLPKIKKDLTKAQSEFLAVIFRGSMGVLNRAAKTVLWEGNAHGVSRPSEDLDSNRFSSTIGDIKLDFNGETLESVFAKLFDTGIKMGKEAERVGLESLSDFLTKRGQVIGPDGNLDGETVLKILDSLEFSITAKDQLDLSNFAFVGSEDMLAKYKDAFKEIEADSILIERLTKILEQKRQDAITRKANRKLVR
jgi:hypothetical protein